MFTKLCIPPPVVPPAGAVSWLSSPPGWRPLAGSSWRTWQPHLQRCWCRYERKFWDAGGRGEAWRTWRHHRQRCCPSPVPSSCFLLPPLPWAPSFAPSPLLLFPRPLPPPSYYLLPLLPWAPSSAPSPLLLFPLPLPRPQLLLAAATAMGPLIRRFISLGLNRVWLKSGDVAYRQGERAWGEGEGERGEM